MQSIIDKSLFFSYEVVSTLRAQSSLFAKTFGFFRLLNFVLWIKLYY